MLIVQKFGGTSLEGRERIFAAARIITQAAKRGSRVVAVVSAQGQTTDEMIAQAISIHPRVTAREMDAYLSTGEQVSAGLLAMAIQAMGYPVVSLTGWQAGIHTDGTHGNARILGLSNDRILQELDREKIVLVAGFQGWIRRETSQPWGAAVPIPQRWPWRCFSTPICARFTPMWTASTTKIPDYIPMP